jgi:hypothetical protein
MRSSGPNMRLCIIAKDRSPSEAKEPGPGQRKEGLASLRERISPTFLFLGGTPGLPTKGDTDLPYR